METSATTGDVELKVYRKGKRELGEGRINVLDIFFTNVTTRAWSSIPKKNCQKFELLKIKSNEEKPSINFDFSYSITCSSEIAETLEIKATLVKLVANPAFKKEGRKTEKTSYHTMRAKSKKILVNMKEKPKFEPGKAYGIYVEQEEGTLKAHCELEGSSSDESNKTSNSSITSNCEEEQGKDSPRFRSTARIFEYKADSKKKAEEPKKEQGPKNRLLRSTPANFLRSLKDKLKKKSD